MTPKLSLEKRFKLISRAFGGESISKICREAHISRILFYRWLKRYRDLGEKGLAPGEFGRPRKSHTPVHPKPYTILSPSAKQKMINEVLIQGSRPTEVAKKYEISRVTLYKWLKRYKQAPQEAKEEAIVEKERKIERFWRQAPEKYEEAVLSLIAKHPEYGVRRLVANLPKIGKTPILGHHGVQNVLRRHNLSLSAQRFVYAQAQITPFTRTIADILAYFTGFFAIPAETRSRIVRFVGVASLSAFVTVVTLGLAGFIARGFVSVSGVELLGMFFASAALFMGSVFFLYSIKYYLTLAIVLSFSQQEVTSDKRQITSKKRNDFLSWILGLANGETSLPRGKQRRGVGLEPDLEHVKLKRYPTISVHIPFYNEKNVVERAIHAATNFDYQGEYEVILADDSTDETTKIIKDYLRVQSTKCKVQRGEGYTLTTAKIRPGVTVKHLHRTSRSGFKGGALRLALRVTDPKAEFVTVFDADFVPYPDTLELFLKYFQVTAGTLDFSKKSRMVNGQWSMVNEKGKETINHQPSTISHQIAAVQGYQWHVLNKSENWITRGVRSEYAGSYVIERSGEEIYSGLKQISGAVYMIRRDVLEEIGWETSITEDFQLTLKLYEAGYKVVYTPYIQAPAECVSTLKHLIRQRMRWAEGHSNNIRRMFKKLLISPNLTGAEKLEFLYLSPYYLQASFFLIGTISWLLAETLFPTRLPFWTSLWGWSLVLTNMLSLPLMNSVGLFLEESEERDYMGIGSFFALTYILVPFQAYAALKGFLERTEGPWFRTPKTGKITDIFTRGRFYRLIAGILPGRAQPAVSSAISHYLSLATANNTSTALSTFGRFYNPTIRPRKIRWVSKATLAVFLIFTILLNYVSFVTPSVVLAQAADPGIEQQVNIIDQVITVGGSDKGMVRIDTTNFTGATYYFEVVAKVTSGSGTAVLTYNAGTGDTPAGGSTLTISSITGTVYTRYRSSSFSPTGEQNAYVSSLTGTGISVIAARIIIIQSDATMLTDTQTNIEIGNNDAMFGARVQRGATTLSSVSSATATVTSVDTSRSFVICGPAETAQTVANQISYTCELTNSTTITFTRGSATGTLVIEWQLVEYDNIRVQASQVQFVATDGSEDYTIPTAVDLEKTFVVMSSMGSGTSQNDNASRYVSANLTSTTNLRLQRNQTVGTTNTEFFIVEFLDETLVQQWSGLTIPGSGTTDDSNDLSTTVDTGRSFFIGYQRGALSDLGMDANTIIIELIDNNTVRATRDFAAPNAMEVEGWVIQLPQEVSGDNGAMVETASTSNWATCGVNISLTNSFDENRSFVWGTSYDDGGGQAWDRAEASFQLTAPTTLRVDCVDPANGDQFRGFAVQLPDWRNVTGPKFYEFTSSDFSGTLSAFFEATLSSSEATASAQIRLYNITDNEAVTGSTLSGSGTTWRRGRSSALTIGAASGNLKTGKEYVVQLNYVSGVESRNANAKLIIEQTDAAGLTAMQLVHTMVNTVVSDTDATYTDQDYLNEFNPSNWVGGTFTYEFEATMRADRGTAYAKLKNDTDGNEIDDDAGCSGDGNPTSEITRVDNDYDRVISAALGPACDWPTAAKNMDTIAKNSAASGNTTSVANSWLIISVTSLQIPENLLLFLPLVLFLPAFIKRFRLKGLTFSWRTLQFHMPAVISKSKVRGEKRRVIEDG